MRIVDIRDIAVPIGAPMRNAVIDFSKMTVSAVAVVTDVVRGGAPVMGFGFNANGRYAQSAVIRERLAPRVLEAPEEHASAEGSTLDPRAIRRLTMRNEKPGGHGERSAAVGVLDAALWDAAAKAAGAPLWRLLAERFNRAAADRTVEVYAAGGHYRPGNPAAALASEVADCRAQGYRTIKIKIAGAPPGVDRERIEAAIDAAGAGGRIAVDANAVLDRGGALRCAVMLADYDLAWFEEPCDPLDFETMRAVAAAWPGALATGENLFSAADARNLLRYGGLRKECDLLQFDVSLSYGIPEYLRIVAAAEAAGWARRRLVPHAGHLFAFNVGAGLGLGGHEVAPDATLVLGGLPDGWTVEDGRVAPGALPGTGFEGKANAMAVLGGLLD